jgi:hypothetical protein
MILIFRQNQKCKLCSPQHEKKKSCLNFPFFDVDKSVENKATIDSIAFTGCNLMDDSAFVMKDFFLFLQI